MVVPVDLIEPMKIKIEQVDKVNTPYPDGASGRQFPQNNTVRSAPFEIDAQVVFGDRDQKGNHTQLGTDEQRKGYVIVRYNDLKKLGKTLKRGDRITELFTDQGVIPVELYLIHDLGDPAAHIGGVFSVVRMFFEDRDPVG